MSRIEDLHKEWDGDPAYREAYEAMADEFSVAGAVLGAREQAGLTQKELARRMEAAQSIVAHLENGASNITVKTLQRVAQATGTHLKISFEQTPHDNAGYDSSKRP